MARNRVPEKTVEYQSESGEEEQEEEASSEKVGSQDSDSEPELTTKASSSTPPTYKKAPQSAAKPHQMAVSSSEEEEEEDSGSESESVSDGPGVQKSNFGPRKPISKPNAAEPVTPAKSTVAKRSVDNKVVVVKDAKKEKKPGPGASEKKPSDDSKKLLFQRLWSEDDEIAILKGMIEYAGKKKSDPVADLNAFHDFIKKNLHVDVTRTQLQDKIRRLKKKYENNKSKEKEGKDRTFTKSHEQKAYELSKNIWGNEAAKETGGEKGLGSPKANGSAAVRKVANKRFANAADSEEDKGSKSVVDVNDGGEKSSLDKRVSPSGLSVEERIMAAGSKLFEAGKGLEGERQWKKLRVEEIEVHLRQLEVKTAQSRLLLDVLKSAEH